MVFMALNLKFNVASKALEKNFIHALYLQRVFLSCQKNILI